MSASFLRSVCPADDCCQQTINCCPPDPWGYLIPSPITVYNTQQCATVACADGSSPTQGCIDAGTFSLEGDPADQAELQAQVDAQAYQAALAKAQANLPPTACTNQYDWCCTANCLRLEGFPTPTCSYAYGFVHAPPGTDVLPGGTNCNDVPPNQVYGFVAAGETTDDAAAQALAQARAMERLGACDQCQWLNDDAWGTQTCGQNDATCVIGSTAPPYNPATQVQVHVAAGSYGATTNKDDANALACNHVMQVLLPAAIKTCNIPSSLSGLTWELPGTSPPPVDYSTQCSPRVVELTTTMIGNPGVTYDCTLLIRGCAEARLYLGTLTGPNTDVVPGTNYFARVHFVPDPTGPPTNPDCPPQGQTNVTAWQGVTQLPRPDIKSNDVGNVYMLIISDPPAVYYLNNLNTPNGRPNVSAYALDDTYDINSSTNTTRQGRGYLLQVKIKQGATVTLRADSLDCAEWNAQKFNLKAADPDPRYHLPLNLKQGTQPYYGQFLQMDCVSATAEAAPS